MMRHGTGELSFSSRKSIFSTALLSFGLIQAQRLFCARLSGWSDAKIHNLIGSIHIDETQMTSLQPYTLNEDITCFALTTDQKTNSQMTTHVLDLDLERLLSPLLRALECHVLKEVGGAVVGGGLVT